MTKYRVFFLCLICFLSFCACDDDDDGIPPATHGVPDSKELNTLTQEEVDQICEDNRKRAVELIESSSIRRDALRISCTVAGLVSTLNGGTKAECEANRDQCIERYSRAAGDSGPRSSGQIAIALPCPPAATLTGCDASVSDFDACTNARLTASQNAIQEASAATNAISCNNAGQPIDASVFIPDDEPDLQIRLPEVPEACTSLLQRCPGAVVF